MKKRCLLCLLLAGVLALGALPAASAAGYADLSTEHWAYKDMDKAAQLGILLGYGEGRMGPDEPLTVGQCLTIAARIFIPEEYAAADRGQQWQWVAYDACKTAGIVRPDDKEFLDFADLDRPITRQDTAVILARAIPARITGKQTGYDENWNSVTLVANERLADYYSAPKTHWSSVDRLFDLGIIQGSPDVSWDGQEILRLNGDNELRRCDGAAMFMRALDKLDESRRGEEKTVTVQVVDEKGNPLADSMEITSAVGRSVSGAVDSQLEELSGIDGVLHYYTRYAEDMYFVDIWEPTVSSVCDVYTLTYYPMNETERARQDFFDDVIRGELSYEDYWWQPFNRYEIGENDYKHNLLFGSRSKRRYSSQSEAKANQVTVTIPMWKIDKSGNKYSTKGSFSINAAIADDVVNIFTEIYNDPERFPIKDLGGYGWRGDSATGEHNCGTAIDINPNENYQIRDGRTMVGSLWKPGENPYSISPSGSVVRIFAKYGWSWGGDAWAVDNDPSYGYHDYMHFSYMGG